jgi:acyl-coenzyme A thioesterase PaaI-like protein
LSIYHREGDAVERGDGLSSVILDALEERLGDRIGEYTFPPPVFAAMQGACVGLDLDAEALTTRFPILESYLNPYGTMQGGMLAAAVDNTLGPLSMLVAAPNVTRQLEITYNWPVTLDIGYIVVEARLLERRDRRLFFRAVVRSPDGLQLARAKAVHWIIEEEDNIS